MNDELMSVLKVIANKRMERIIEGLLNEDAAYRRLSKSVCSMEWIYDALNLGSDIKVVVDQLLTERGGMNMEKTSLTYWAGMMDAIIILRSTDTITLA